jgi:hypothetical protein
MAGPEKRKSLRRVISYPAAIIADDGTPPVGCALCNASQEGAQLIVAEPERIPDRFVLALSADGAARRKCRVVWRSGDQIGVQFIKPANKAGATASARMMRQLLQAAKAANSTETPEAATEPAEGDAAVRGQ